MIERYSRPEMSRIWGLENKFRAWLRVEIAVCEAWHNQGVIPADAMQEIREKADFDVDRIQAIEEETKHDVIAFLTAVEEKVGEVEKKAEETAEEKAEEKLEETIEDDVVDEKVEEKVEQKAEKKVTGILDERPPN